MPAPRPTAPAERLAHLDVVRALALFGVLMVNLLTDFRVSLFEYLAVFHTHPGRANHAVDLASGLLLETKAFALFALLFGAGMAAQSGRAARYLPLAARRFGVLLALGVVHITLIWNGDILTLYALLGLALAPLVALAPPRAWLGASLACLALCGLGVPRIDALPHGDALARHLAGAARAYGHGTWTDALSFRAHETRRYIAPLLLSVVPRIAGLMLLGAWAFRRGIAREPDAHRGTLGACALAGLVLGGGATATEAWAAMHAVSLRGWAPAVSALGTVGTALGYGAAALLALTVPRVRGVVGAALAPLGQMALTNYLAQSVVWSLVFYGYGLGLFHRVGSAHAALLGTALYALQALLSARWLARYRFGPVEWLWRSLTYGARQPMRRAPAARPDA